MDIFRLTGVKLTTGLENFRGVVSDDLSFASVEVEKNYWLTLPRWKRLCHRLSRDQPQPRVFLPTTNGGREERPWERGTQMWPHTRNCDRRKPHKITPPSALTQHSVINLSQLYFLLRICSVTAAITILGETK